MAQQLIGIGAAPDDGNGDPLRDAMDKCNDNFTELYQGRFQGALVKKTGDQTADFSGGVTITFDAEEYDDGGWHDNVTNNSRLTVLAGVNRVSLEARIRVSNITADVWVVGTINKNGGAFLGAPAQTTEAGVGAIDISLKSPVLPVTPGDYFELRLQNESTDLSITAASVSTWFSIEAVSWS